MTDPTTGAAAAAASTNTTTTTASTTTTTTTSAPTKKSVVPVQVQRSILEWLDSDLGEHSPARTGKVLGPAALAKHFPASRGIGGGIGIGIGGGMGGRSNSPRTRGTRRQRQKEHSHVFVENPELQAVHPANAVWCYASYTFKLQDKPEDAQAAVFRIIARVVERAQRLLDASTAAMARGDASKEAMSAAAQAAAIDAMMPQPPSQQLAAESEKTAEGLLPHQHPLQKSVAGGRFRAKIKLVFDLISTRKHITQDFRNGLPYRLGEEIYEHCQRKYVDSIATCFVGLTDNPAQRVGRDIFYNASDDLSTSHLPFGNIDYGHLFVVFPPDSKRLSQGPQMTEYDENCTRFLEYAASGVHEHNMSSIPGRPPPAHSLAGSARGGASPGASTTFMTAGGAAGAGAPGQDGPLTAQGAAQLIAMHRQAFSNSPKKHGGGVGGARGKSTSPRRG